MCAFKIDIEQRHGIKLKTPTTNQILEQRATVHNTSLPISMSTIKEIAKSIIVVRTYIMFPLTSRESTCRLRVSTNLAQRLRALQELWTVRSLEEVICRLVGR